MPRTASQFSAEQRAQLRNVLGAGLGDALIDKLDGVDHAASLTVSTGLKVDKQSGGGRGLHIYTITLTDVAVAVADSGGASGGFGSLQLLDFPIGVVRFLESRTNLTVVASGLIGATATVKTSIGTAAEATNDTLDSTQANIIASTSSVLTASAGTVKGVGVSTPPQVDGSVTPVDVFLNVGVADAGLTGAGSVLLNGTITLITLGPIA